MRINWMENHAEKVWEYTTRDGVRVTTTSEPPEQNWWDNFFLHFIWSYASWTSNILLEQGFPGMRVFLGKMGWWGVPKKRLTRREVKAIWNDPTQIPYKDRPVNSTFRGTN